LQTPEQISSETRTQFPIGSLVQLSEKGRKFTPQRWWNRKGKVIGWAMRDWGSHSKACEPFCRITKPEVLLLVVWEGRTRRRIVRKHRSDFTLCVPRKSKSRSDAVGGPR
jgi:hypothetical protein